MFVLNAENFLQSLKVEGAGVCLSSLDSLGSLDSLDSFGFLGFFGFLRFFGFLGFLGLCGFFQLLYVFDSSSFTGF
jgi:hypothetical protein